LLLIKLDEYILINNTIPPRHLDELTPTLKFYWNFFTGQ